LSVVKTKKFDLKNPTPVVDDEDEITLAATDEGLRDVAAGRTIAAEETRKRVSKWITASPTPQ